MNPAWAWGPSSIALLIALGRPAADAAEGCADDGARSGLEQISQAAALSAGPSSHPGMGAVVHEGGVSFRIWLPDGIRSAAVIVNGGEPRALAEEGDGLYSLDVPGAAAGDRYHFDIVDRDGNTLERNDPRAAWLTGLNGEGIIHDPNAYQWQHPGFEPAPARVSVLYEAHVGSFRPDPANDGIGTFRSAADGLGWAAALGITHMEWLPVAQSSRKGKWGYGPRYFFATDVGYGPNPDDFKFLVDVGHGLGLGSILDWVPNHAKSSTPDAPVPMHNLDGGFPYYDLSAPTKWGPRFQVDRPEVYAFLLENWIRWMREFHLDGGRIDSTNNFRMTGQRDIPAAWRLLQEVAAENRALHPRNLTIWEDLQGFSAVTRPADDGSRNGGFRGGGGASSQWDNHFWSTIFQAVTKAKDRERNMFAVRDAIRLPDPSQGLTQRVIFTENHDHPRLPGMIQREDPQGHWARKRSTLAAAILFTSPGIPMLLQLQECLEDHHFSYPIPPPANWSRCTENAGIVKLYSDLIRLRVNADGHTAGLTGSKTNVFHVNDDPRAKVVAYHRWRKGGPGDDVIVLANFTGRPFTSYDIGLPRGGTWKVRLNTDLSEYSPDFADTPSGPVTARSAGQDGLPFHGSVGIGPYSVVVLSQDPD